MLILVCKRQLWKNRCCVKFGKKDSLNDMEIVNNVMLTCKNLIDIHNKSGKFSKVGNMVKL